MDYKSRLDKVLNESGLSRLYSYTLKHDYGTITAFRNSYTHRQNMQRNRSLLAKLRASGYGVTGIKGSYIENYKSPNAVEVQEDSYFVVDLQDKKTLEQDLRNLGQFFEQDSILFGEAGSPSVLIGTSDRPGAYPGLGVVLTQGGAIFGKTGEFMSRVHGRPFVLEKAVIDYGLAKYPSELRGPVAESRLNWWDIDL